MPSMSALWEKLHCRAMSVSPERPLRCGTTFAVLVAWPASAFCAANRRPDSFPVAAPRRELSSEEALYVVVTADNGRTPYRCSTLRRGASTVHTRGIGACRHAPGDE